MKLKELIIEILKRGGRYKSAQIANKASLLDYGFPYTKEDVKDVIFNELKSHVNYDKFTYEYYIGDKTPPKVITIDNKDILLETLRINEKSMTIIDIANFIKLNFKKNINIDELLLIIVKDLVNDIGIDRGKPLKYFLLKSKKIVNYKIDKTTKLDINFNIDLFSFKNELLEFIKEGNRLSAYFFFKQNINIKSEKKINEIFNLIWDKYQS
jgi:hypothetical protein